MSSTTPAINDRSTRTMPPQTLRRLILRGIAQQSAAIDAGDIDLAEAYARATTMLFDHHLHGARYWTERR